VVRARRGSQLSGPEATRTAGHHSVFRKPLAETAAGSGEWKQCGSRPLYGLHMPVLAYGHTYRHSLKIDYTAAMGPSNLTFGMIVAINIFPPLPKLQHRMAHTSRDAIFSN